MKVYVDKMPKCCNKCEWFTPNHCGNKGGRNFCLLARMPFYNTEAERATRRGQNKNGLSDFDCPLKSLAEHDKQVRKEVCEKIKNEARNLGGIRTGEKLFINLDNIVNLINEVIGEKNVSCSF